MSAEKSGETWKADGQAGSVFFCKDKPRYLGDVPGFEEQPNHEERLTEW